jgi:DNA-binding CsgD family transcriptional regulator
MARADAILTAVQRIHEAPLAPEGWARALPSIAAVAGSQQAVLYIQDAAGRTVQTVVGCGVDPNLLVRFKAAAPASPWWNAVATGVTARRSALFPDRQFLLSTLYNEVVRVAGSFHGIVTPLLRERQHHVHLILARIVGRDDYEGEDVAVMQALVPHLVTALRVSHRVAAADIRAAAADAALDRLETGVVLVDAAGKVLFANRVAEAILSSGDGLGSNREGLCASDPRVTRTLRRLATRCADTAPVNGNSVSIPRGEGRPPLHVVVAPFGSEAIRAEIGWMGPARPVAILIVTDPERARQVHRKQLRERYGMTAAEADFALEIVKGDGRQAAAVRLGVSLATARTHLERIFAKTGVHRQAELVRVLLRERGHCAQPDE